MMPEGQIGVLVRAYRRVSTQTSREREMTAEMPQGEIALGVVGERMPVQCLGIPGLETLRVNLDYVRLFGKKKELKLFKAWLVKGGNQLPRRQQPDRYSGQIYFDVLDKGVHIKTEGKEIDGVLFMAPGGVMVEVHLGDIDRLKEEYVPKERIIEPSADWTAKIAVGEIIEKRIKNEQKQWGWWE